MGLRGLYQSLVESSEPSRVALCDGLARRRTWGSLLEEVDSLADAISPRVTPNARIAIPGTNSIGFVLRFLACAKLDAIPVLISPYLTERETRSLLKIAAVQHILSSSAVVTHGGSDWSAVGQRHCLGSVLSREPCRNDPVLNRNAGLVIFTSGSEAEPKGVVLRTDALIQSSREIAKALGLRPGGNHVSMLRMFHVGGIVIDLLAPWTASSSVCLSGRFDSTRLLKHFGETGFTSTSYFETQFGRLISKCETTLGEAGLSAAYIAGPPRLYRMSRIQGLQRITNIYALTEGTCPVAHVSGYELDERVRAETCGKPLPGISLHMRRLEQDQGAAYEEIGFDGWNKFLGYTGRGEHHGVFWTGDLGYLDAKGNLVYLGRSISVIKSGGENISCLEVEVALQEILGEECESVFVVGIPDPNWGEAAIALVKSRDASGSLVSRLLQAEVLRAECRRVLAGYKIPRKFVDREALRRWAVTNGQLVIASGMG